MKRWCTKCLIILGLIFVVWGAWWIWENNLKTEETPPITETTLAPCIKTGCSGQVCSDEEIITDCVYKQEYACYQDATCERQPSGECGWTLTPNLIQCLEATDGIVGE
ncbi:MAG: hypothetical protein WCV86_02030 [Patescibacteria group bacterium]|jgi:hypothetical protein